MNRANLSLYACDLTRSVRAGPGFSRGETGRYQLGVAHKLPIPPTAIAPKTHEITDN